MLDRLKKTFCSSILSGRQIFIRVSAFCFFFLLSQSTYAATLYVDCSLGSDLNDCTFGNDCQTIAQAVTNAISGDTISVAAGTCTVTAAINPGSKDLVFQGAGVQGSTTTTIVQGSGTVSSIFSLNHSLLTSSTILKNFVIKASSGYAVYIGSGATPIVQNNVILGDDDSSGYSSVYISYSTPTVENNIVVGGYNGIFSDSSSSAVIRNNTVVNTIADALREGDRYNNIAYLNFGNGLGVCNVNNTGHYNTAFGNDTNYSNCSTYNTSADAYDPHFNVSAAGISTGLTTTTLTMTGAGWTDHQWAGYFVTPNANRTLQAGYFYILDNTADTLEILSDNTLTGFEYGGSATYVFGSAGDAFAITDFSTSTASPVYGTGTTGSPSTDIYGNTRTNDTRGAAFATASTSQGRTILVDAAAAPTSNTGDCTGAACVSLLYGMAVAHSSDTVQVSGGLYNIARSLGFGGRGITVSGITLHGTDLVRIEPSGALANGAFRFTSGEETGTLKYVSLLANGGTAVFIGNGANPTISSNIISGDDDSSGYSSIYVSYSDPIIENNIILGGYNGVFCDSSDYTIVRNNTAVNTIADAFREGDRYNNIAYLNYGNGVGTCNVLNTGHYNTAFGNDTNYSNCSIYNTSADAYDPHFNVSAAGISLKTGDAANALTATTLTMTGAGWTDHQWAGYFVTPNANRTHQAGYFLIVDNTSDTLTVVGDNTMTGYELGGSSSYPFAAVGDAFVITDFSVSTSSPVYGTGTTGSPSTDIYGNTRTNDTRGAVFATTATTQSRTIMVDDDGGGTNTSDCTGASCPSLLYGMAVAHSSDTVQVSGGLYNIARTLGFGGRGITVSGITLHGTDLVRIEPSGALGNGTFRFTAGEETGTLKYVSFLANSGQAVYIGNGANPTISSNIISGDDDNSGYSTIYISYSDPTIENNIIVGGYNGVYASSSETSVIRNNTVINTIGNALVEGDRYNNIAYLNFGSGLATCNSSNTGHYNTAFGNDVNFTSCSTDNTGTDAYDPHFNVSAAGISTALTTTTLSMTGAGWTDHQWAGYFVTPNANRTHQAGYFLIVDNTTDTLEVVGDNTMTGNEAGGSASYPFGAVNDAFMITDFTTTTASPVYGTGTSGSPSTDIYGNTRTNDTRGAAFAAASTSQGRTILVDAAAAPTSNTGDCTGAACVSLLYGMSVAHSSDTVQVSGGLYNIARTLGFGGRGITVAGTGIKGSNLVRIEPTTTLGSGVFRFTAGEETGTLKNVSLLANSGYGIYIGNGANPTISGNLISGDDDSSGYQSILTSYSDPIIENNIVVCGYDGIYADSSTSATIRNNTVLNVASQGFREGDRYNNIAYMNLGSGIATCSSANEAISNSAYGNGSNLVSCSEMTGVSANVTTDPAFVTSVTGTSTSLTGTVLTDSTKTWTTNQWKGYWITPDTSETYPRYFLIVSNGTDNVTVIGDNLLTATGTVGNTYRITDFTPTASGVKDAANNTYDSVIDIYGLSRPNNTTSDMGAVEYELPPNITISDPTVSEGNSGSTTASFTVTLSGTYSQDITVDYTTANNTATAGSDYTATSGTLTITAGLTTGTINVTVAGDTLYEASETFYVNLSNASHSAAITDSQGLGTITNDDTAPSVTFTSSSQSAAESSSMTVTASLSGLAGIDVTVPYVITGTATGSGTDYTITTSPITISAGSSSGDISITVNDDSLDEEDETVIVTMGTPTNASQGATTVHTATITDNDAAPTVTIGLSGATFAENAGTSTVTATLSAVSGKDVTVTYSFSGTATNTTDYTRSAGSVIISAGDTTGDITLTGVSDSVDEADETVIIDIATVTNGTESGTQQETAQIIDDDAAPTVTLSSSSSTIAEDGGVATLTATLSALSEQTVTVNLAFSGTATNGVDYNPSASSITITAGLLTGTATVTSVNQLASEGTETIITDISSVVNGTESGTQTVTVSILDGNVAPVISGLLVYSTLSESETGQEDGTGFTTLTPFFEFVYNDDDNQDATKVNITVLEVEGVTETEFWVLDDNNGTSGILFSNLTQDDVPLDDIAAGETSPRIRYMVEGADGNLSATELEWCTTYTVRAKAFDSGGAESNELETTFKTNCSPNLGSVGDVLATELGNTTVTLSFTESDSDSVTVSCSAPTLRRAGININDYVTLNNDNTVTIAISERAYFSQLASITSGSHTVTCTISDGSLSSTTSFSLSFGSSNNSPTFTAIDDQTVSEGDALTVSIAASDPDNDDITISSRALPRGASVTDRGSGQGIFSWTPSLSQAGTYTITIVATDDGSPGKSATEQFIVTVTNVNQAPVISAINSTRVSNSVVTLAAEVGVTESWQITATDPDSDTLSYSLAPEVSNMSVNSSTGVITFSPSSSQRGSLSTRVIVSDGNETDVAVLSVTVVSDQEPLADAGESTTVMGGRRVRLDGSGSLNARTYRWRQVRGPEATLSNSDEAVAIAVTPRVGGTLVFELTVTSAKGKSSTAYTRIAAIPNEPRLSEFTGRSQQAVLAVDRQGNRLEAQVREQASTSSRSQVASCLNFATSKVRSLDNRWVIADYSRDNGRGRLWMVPKGEDVCADTDAISGFSEGDELGREFALGDLDGDNETDVIVSAPGAGSTGQAYVFSENLNLKSLITDAEFEDAKIMDSDLNQDSISDLTVLTSTGDSSVSYVYLGNSALPSNLSVTEDADLTIETAFVVDTIESGDVNGDSIPDVLMGSAEVSRVYLFFGEEDTLGTYNTDDADVVIVASGVADGFATQINLADITGDGVNDVIIGSPDEGTSGQGAVYMLPGSAIWEPVVNVSEEGAAMRIEGEESESHLGEYLATGDTNEDGIDDLILYDQAIGVSHFVSLADVVDLSSSGSSLAGLSFSGGGGCDVSRIDWRDSASRQFLLIHLMAFAFFVSSLWGLELTRKK